ncbi:MAG: ribose-5-phosphate isomerase RpiA, partial [Enterovibrio sp.]
MTQDDKKKAAAWAALKFVPQDSIIGVGTGSTANHFIEALGSIKDQIKGAVASSNESAKALQALGITVFDA